MPTNHAPSTFRDVMGSLLHDGGCTFRVWAPNAERVELELRWPDGTTGLVTLERDHADGYGHGCWSAFVVDVEEETRYHYRISHGGQVHERVDPVARCIVYPRWSPGHPDDSGARSLVTSRDFDWGPGTFHMPGWRELIIYQLHVGTFVRTDPGAPGTLHGLIAQLPYLRDLGVNAIQLLPFTEFASAMSLGYNSVLPYALEADYGRPRDLKELVKAAHGLGLAVIVDVVFNHICTDNGGPALPYSLFAYDGWTSPSNHCGIYFYGGEEMNTPFGPRPDYGRPEVRRYLRDNALMWLEEYQADGLRFDCTKCVRKLQGSCTEDCCGEALGRGGRNFGWELLREINEEINRRQGWKLTIAEDLDDNPGITAGSAGGAGFDAQWDRQLRGVVRAAVSAPDDQIDVGAVARALENPVGGQPFARVLYVESHDEAKGRRLPDLLRPGDAEGWLARKKTLLATALMVTAPGIPMIFQGQEMLDWRRWSEGLPMEWWRAGRFSRYRQFHIDLFAARRNRGGVTRGLCGAHLSVIQANPETKVLAYQRWDRGAGQDDLVVVANLSQRTLPGYRVGLPYDGTWQVRLNSDAGVYSDFDDFDAVPCGPVTAQPVAWDGRPFSGTVSLGPCAVVILGR